MLSRESLPNELQKNGNLNKSKPIIIRKETFCLFFSLRNMGNIASVPFIDFQNRLKAIKGIHIDLNRDGMC